MTVQCVRVVNMCRSLVVVRPPLQRSTRVRFPSQSFLGTIFIAQRLRCSTSYRQTRVRFPPQQFTALGGILSTGQNTWPKYFWQTGQDPIYFEQRDNVHAVQVLRACGTKQTGRLCCTQAYCELTVQVGAVHINVDRTVRAVHRSLKDSLLESLRLTFAKRTFVVQSCQNSESQLPIKVEVVKTLTFVLIHID